LAVRRTLAAPSLVARRTRAGQQDFVDHMDDAVVSFDVCNDNGRHFTGTVCDCDAAVSRRDAQTLCLIDWLEVVGTCGEITSHQDAVIYVVQQDVSQLAFVFWQQQCFDRALWQGVKGSIYGRVSRECTWARERPAKPAAVTAATRVVKRSSPAAISVMDRAEAAAPAIANVAAAAIVFRCIMTVSLLFLRCVSGIR
jgi:hypothetical protein